MADNHALIRGDHTLQVAHQMPFEGFGNPKPAVVMVPILMRPEPTVLLTVRASSLREHSGQISFPGGRVDETDKSLYAAALREADEEIGLPQDKVSLLGYLDFYLSVTNYLVTPVVAKVAPDFVMQLNPDEVDEAFEVPLAFLMNPEKHELHSRMLRGMKRYYYAIPYQERYIWGVTAGIIHNMYERLFTS
ncbi:CoA pyrophosphatase [Microvirga sp. W0021]|uniref:CoA pyrophosphatase n=1 Tax=Hohaiivirga grylli TaxID=3133970 RepID=A0ABV0BNH7_9HYPH